MRTKSAALSAVLALVLFLSACKSGDASQNAARSLEQRLLSGAAPLAEEAHGSPRALTLESVHYGSFSSPDAEELCALFRYDAPAHVEGLDRTLGVVYAADDLEVVAGCDLMADDVQVSFLPAADGTERIFYLGAATHQGLTSYTLDLYKVSGAAWEPIKTGLPVIEEGGAVYLTGEKVLFVTPADVCTVYEWNGETEGFEPAGTPEGGTIAEGTGACVFPGGPSTVAENARDPVVDGRLA